MSPLRFVFVCGALMVVIAGCAPTVALPGPKIVEPSIASDTLVMADGNERTLQAWLPDGEPRVVILALHGFNDYANAFAAPGAAWAARGIATFAYDQRGFGRDAEPGIWHGEAIMIDDALAALSLLQRRYPGTPVYLLGESMGGAVATLTAAHNPAPPIDGLILVAPAVWARSTMPVSYRVGLWLGAHLAPSMTLRGSNLEIWPSDNIEMLRALSADPLIIKESRVDAIYGLVNLMDAALLGPGDIGFPTLVVYGANDQIVPAEPVGLFVAGLPPGNRVAVYEAGYHMLLRDLEAQIVLDDIAAWVTAPHASLPSDAEVLAATFFIAPPEPPTAPRFVMGPPDPPQRGS